MASTQGGETMHIWGGEETETECEKSSWYNNPEKTLMLKACVQRRYS